MGSPVFKTGEVEYLGLAGSIPVRLRHMSIAAEARGGAVSIFDPRRNIPRTDTLLALEPVVDARQRLGDSHVRDVIRRITDDARAGQIPVDEVQSRVLDALRDRPSTTLRAVLNATGVVVHTNLGRAPLSAAALDAVIAASGYVDVELDLDTGTRSKRGRATKAALLAACPAAEDALMVNNGAAAMVLATTALAAGREVIISRGEMIEIGAGFRLTDLIESTGARLREVGTTNRTHLRDYAAAINTAAINTAALSDAGTGCVLKVHPSNFRVEGFTTAVDVADLAELAAERGVPLVADIGSGLLTPDPTIPDEPDATTWLDAGADVVIASGDKLLGGPQAGILLGRAEIIGRLARHPLARAVRADKLALAAMEATLAGGQAPVSQYLHADADALRARTDRLAHRLNVEVVAHDGRVGGGGAPGVPLHGWALRLPEQIAKSLRTGDPAVLPRVHDGACLIDLRCVPPDDDERLGEAIARALG